MSMLRGVTASRWLLVALVCLALVAGCSEDFGAPRDQVGSRSFLSRAEKAARTGGNRVLPGACPATMRTASAASAIERQHDMDTVMLPTWRSGDVGVTTPLSDGRVLWLFGDTVRAAGISPRLVGNSMLISSGRCFAEVSVPRKAAVIDGFPADEACWPNSATTIPMKTADIVVVGCSRVTRGTNGLFDFHYTGLTLTTFVVRPGAAPQRVTQLDLTHAQGDEPINWGAALAANDGWVYIYGSRQPKTSGAKGAYVARARVAGLNARSTWHYWDGHGFVSGASSARPFLPVSDGVSQTFSVASWHGRFLLVSKQGGEFGSNVGVWSSPTPYGPWSGAKAVAEPYDQGGGVVAYQPLAHPELHTPSGALLVSLSRTTVSFGQLLSHPQQGRPKFLEISLP